MGSVLSSALASRSDEANHYPIAKRRLSQHYVGGVPVPPEASIAPQDSQDLYDDFFERAFCTRHKDGASIIIFEPDDGHPNPRTRAGWAIKRLQQAYNLLNGDHPRIVRYVGGLHSSSGVVVEKLMPGPMCFPLPALGVPVTQTLSREDRVMLSLYYRWALQVLSAFSFVHSRPMYIKNFLLVDCVAAV